MNIDGLSEATLEKLIARGFIHSFADIFRLKEHRQEIVEMEGLGEKSFENLMNSIDRARNTTLPRLIYGLGDFQYRIGQRQDDLPGLRL